jgi:hypothetical protein
VWALPGRLTMMSRHSERAPIPSFPHLKDSSGCGLWVVRCAVSAVCAPCARVCLSAAPKNIYICYLEFSEARLPRRSRRPVRATLPGGMGPGLYIRISLAHGDVPRRLHAPRPHSFCRRVRLRAQHTRLTMCHLSLLLFSLSQSPRLANGPTTAYNTCRCVTTTNAVR